MRWVLMMALVALPALPAAAQGMSQGAGQACVHAPDPGDRNSGMAVERFMRLGCARGDVVNAAFPTPGWRNAFAALLCDFERQVLFSEEGGLALLTCVANGPPRAVRR